MALEVVMPRLSDSMEEGTIVRWLVAEGDAVAEGQELVEVETDKATVTYEAESSGVVLALRADEGATIAVGAPMAVIGEAGESVEPPAGPESNESLVEAAEAPTAAGVPERAGVSVSRPGPAAPAPPAAGSPTAPAAPSASSPGTSPGRAKASPLARRLAAEMGVDLAGIGGTGPNGRVTRADVLRSAEADGDASSAAPAGQDVAAARDEGGVQELTRVQRTIARRMAESRATVPDFELRAEVDMSRVVGLRQDLAALGREPVSFNDFVVRACALALREFPRVNAAYRDGAVELFDRVNVGIAVAAEGALVVPTIFDADTKRLEEIGRESRAVAERVRDGSISPSELGGGTFTVSNLGMYGVDSFSAVINPPQAAILAVGSLKSRAAVGEHGDLTVRPTMHLTLACDHRVLYGADGARFLARVRELLERPVALLL